MNDSGPDASRPGRMVYMTIMQFSKERGVFAIFNGYGKQAYIFHSSFYGAVGYADILDEPGSN